MAREVIRIRDEFYIRSSSHRIDVRTRVLKQADTFAVFDRFGDIEPFGTGELGVYYQDTRFLCRLTLMLGKDRPLLLSSTIRDDNAVLAVDATNADVWRNGEILIPQGTLHVFQSTTTGARLLNFRSQSNSMLISLTSSKCEVLGGNSAASGYRHSLFRMAWCSRIMAWMIVSAGRESSSIRHLRG